jgi:acyl carrier protein
MGGKVRRVRTIAAEDTFGVPLPDENLERFQTVGEVIDYIRDPMIAA